MKYTNHVQYVFPYILEFLISRLYTFPNVRTEKPKELNRRHTIINKMKFYILFRIFQILIFIPSYNAIFESNKIFK